MDAQKLRGFAEEWISLREADDFSGLGIEGQGADWWLIKNLLAALDAAERERDNLRAALESAGFIPACSCGWFPPDDANPDCPRCQEIVKAALARGGDGVASQP
jgi:hypothetical protein